MLEEAEVAKVDKSGLYRIYEAWPEYAIEASNIRVNLPSCDKIENIILAGMGGSACPADMIKSWLSSQIEVPLAVVRDSRLPNFVSKNTLVIASSISGDTRETIMAAREAHGRKAILATMSAGGKLEQFSKKHSIPHTNVRKLQVPRASLLFVLFPTISLLSGLGIIRPPRYEIDEAKKTLSKIWGTISVNVPFERNPSKALADRLRGGIPAIFATDLLSAAAVRFKDCLNENSKIHAFSDSLPEIAHNEIEAWNNDWDDVLKPILLRQPVENENVRERFKAFEELFNARGITPSNVVAEGETVLSNILGMIYLLDYASIYLAVVKKVDPTPTPNIDALKTKLDARLSSIDMLV
ncbi:MAG: SIS domain-containing protein [Thaumarchaeota archaeon]|nr:SIS domain-containing protein [Nitrososphaerota archaeon]